MNRCRALLALTMLSLAGPVRAGEYFIEAESFTANGGWSVVEGGVAKQASGLKLLSGAQGRSDDAATTTVSVKDAGHYRIWVRYSSHPKWRGPFHLTALRGDTVLGDGLFDTAFEGRSARDTQTWRSFDADLPEGDVTLRLSKHASKNSPGVSRLIDCLLLTMDDKVVPNHLNYGAQTFVRVTLGEGHEKPAYIHIFADHYHADWYSHWSLGKAGAVEGIRVNKADLLVAGESTGWCNITPTVYQDSGAMLFITARHSYTDYADKLHAVFEFATAPDEKSVVRRIDVNNKPGTVVIYAPPNLLTKENLALLKTDREIADATGALADAHTWPTHGKRPERFPFFATAMIHNNFTPYDQHTLEREEKTFGCFSFSDEHLRRLGGVWFNKDKSYCQPDIDKMKKVADDAAKKFKERGGDLKNVAFSELTDEPTGQPLEIIAKDPAYLEHFRKWLKEMGKTPQDLLVASWDEVKLVTLEQRAQFPALYLYSQRFRTRALGDFMETQRGVLEAAYGGSFPVLANFSDGAIYTGNFCAQGVDYFELLDSSNQNAIWGEDWSNGASTYQCASFNVDLMRAAARERGQVIGHHLVAHANRKPWDIKLKATSEAARGVKIFNSFAYGPTWATHEGGPYFRSHVWQGRPETWTACASITREIGAVEDVLVPAMPAPAKVALLYSSSSDAWTIENNLAFGFERMHTWLALSHAQMPVDPMAERQVEKDMLDDYRVCYMNGPNLTRASAGKVKRWVQNGGTLWLTADAATRDEFNHPLEVLNELLPVKREAAITLQSQSASGRSLGNLAAKDEVQWTSGKAVVVSVKQRLVAGAGAEVLAKFGDGSPALVSGAAGKGKVYVAGFLPALAYIKSALDARSDLEKRVAAGGKPAGAELLERTYNPWQYPGDLRDLILTPARDAKIAKPIECSAPLVDAVLMVGGKGMVVPLANYTAVPIDKLSLRITVPRAVASVESAVRGRLEFRQASPTSIELTLPLDSNDFLKVLF